MNFKVNREFYNILYKLEIVIKQTSLKFKRKEKQEID